ncbi:gag-protease polyprotein [Cucumis melo var. makuwa]|uniref:Gag-protease polyprotein n=1 Tax=Cucumis melo var. makuwa TaxID=1194695 RepID=A0A5A7TJT1_CUCMM|nr:gag-protease polyprotein [Cucumis melo var. makuwa]TYK30809.1 gag-protease polyprotein [Cucumis melo var. makuwa]
MRYHFILRPPFFASCLPLLYIVLAPSAFGCNCRRSFVQSGSENNFEPSLFVLSCVALVTITQAISNPSRVVSPKTSFVLGVPLGSPKTRDVPTGSLDYMYSETHQFRAKEEVEESCPSSLARKYNPKTFDGSLEDRTKAHMWLASMETIFRYMKCPNNQKVRLRDAKQREFLNLEQDDMTVEQYDAEFDMLSHFAPMMVANEATKTKKLVRDEEGFGSTSSCS